MADMSWLDAHPLVADTPATTAPAADTSWLDAHPVVEAATSPNPPMSDGMKYVANAVTGLNNSIGVAGGLPHSIAALGDFIGSKLGASPEPGFITRHTYSPNEINDAINRYGGLVTPEALMSSDPDVQAAITAPKTAYKPETFWGKVGQDALSTAPIALIGGGGVPALIARQTANLAGVTGGEGAKVVWPDSPGLQMAAALAAALVGDRVPPAVAATGRASGTLAGRLLNMEGAANKTAAGNIVNKAGVPASDLVATIDQNVPGWTLPDTTLQPQPTTATVTANPGLMNMTYMDEAAAGKAGNPIYRNNALTTNAAQREAVANITPDIEPQITQARGDLSTATSALPAGVTAQEAGSQFRTGLQNVYDQRLEARRQLGSNVFDALDSSPAQISLRPVMDYATEQAAQNAGEVGAAYKAAGNQFQSGTGLILDTAPFANSVLKGLGDLSASYPVGSAAQHAVNEIKTRAEQAIFNQEPAISGARQAYADASRPLDVFNPKNTPGPIANAVQTTRFGGYVTSNDAVVNQFLRSTGSADAIDRLNSIFPDTTAATQSLRDYIASQVQARAVKADGTVDLAALQGVTKPFETVLNKLPFAGIRNQFSTIRGAQEALDQLTTRQKLYDTFANGLGTMERDTQGNPIYSAAKFDGFVKANQPDLIAAYGRDGADRLSQINKQLTDIAQTAYSRVKGQSGTPQASRTTSAGGTILSTILGESLGDFAGILAQPIVGAMGALSMGLGGTIAGYLASSRLKGFNSQVEEITRNALTDPAFARSLLVNYSPKLPTPAGTRAMDYVRNRIAGVIAPAASVGQ